MTIVESSIQVSNQKLGDYFDRLDYCLNDLFSFLRPYHNEDLNRKPDPKSWSILQIIHHLILSEESAVANIKRRLEKSSYNIQKASATSKLRAMVLVSSLKQPLKLTAPPIVSDPIPDESSLEEVKGLWLEKREELKRFLANLSDETLESECFKHPVIGLMDIWGMLEFFEVHFQRHYKQINKTAYKVVILG
jgi:hypothetical protein